MCRAMWVNFSEYPPDTTMTYPASACWNLSAVSWRTSSLHFLLVEAVRTSLADQEGPSASRCATIGLMRAAIWSAIERRFATITLAATCLWAMVRLASLLAAGHVSEIWCDDPNEPACAFVGVVCW